MHAQFVGILTRAKSSHKLKGVEAIFQPNCHSRMQFNPINALVSVSFILLAVALMPASHADIHKCTDEYGNVAYLQTPCPAEEVEKTAVTHDTDARIAEAAQDEEMTESSPEPQSPEAQIPSSRRPGEPLDVCKKRYRDQIDEIDAEIRSAFSPAQGDAYKERLLALTRQLRACG